MKQLSFLGVGLLFWLILAVSFPLVMAGRETFYFGDNTTLFIPLKGLAAERLKAGQLPLWNPYTFSGTPLLADAAIGTLSPFMLWFVLLPPAQALAVSSLLALWLSGMGMYAFLTRHTKKTLPALVGGIAWMLSGSMLERTSNVTILETLAFIPWVFALSEQYLLSRSKLSLIGAAVALALSFYAGYIPLIVLFLLLFGVWFLVQTSIPLKERAGALALIFFLGAGMAALQLVPFMELFLHSTRAHFAASEGVNAAVPFLSLPRLWLPTLFGARNAGNSWGIGAAPETGWASTDGYLPIALWLIFLTAQPWRKGRRLWPVLASIALLLSLGGQTVLGNLWAHTPILQGVRPYQALVVFSFALIVAAIEGLASLKKFFVHWRWGLAVVIMGVGLWGLTPRLASMAATQVSAATYAYDKLQVIIRTFGFGVIEMGIILLLLSFKRWWKVGLVLGVCANVLLLSRGSVFTANNAWFSPHSAVTERLTAQFDPNYRFISWAGTDPYSDFDPLFNQLWVRPPFYPSLMGRDENKNLAVLQNKLKELPPSVSAALHLPSANGYVGMMPTVTARYWGQTGVNKLTLSLTNTARLSASSVRYALIPTTTAVPLGWKVIDSDGHVQTAVNLQALPRAYVLTDGGVQPATISASAAARVVASVNTSAPGQLVLTDTYYPGWEAIVDSTPQLVTPYRESQRQVVVGAGKHEVTFIYRPASVSAGKWIAFFSLLLMLTLVGVFWLEVEKMGGKNR